MSDKAYVQVVPPTVSVEDIKKELREAIEKSNREGNTYPVNDFFCKYRGKLPREIRGNRDRTFGFEQLTTIVRAFGEEGIRMYHRMYPHDKDVETACIVIIGKPLKDVCPDIHKKIVRMDLIDTCRAMISGIGEILEYEEDHIMQHSLSSLRDECKWCVRELTGQNE